MEPSSVRDTRQAVDAARTSLCHWIAQHADKVTDGGLGGALVDQLERTVRADEYRRIMDAGTDADAWGEAKP
jgi:hypothetical protein